ncbi:glutathione S-transferase T1-like [Olea europaea subsp. europaea]|uniref:glutathione transferase n=1 Tax=Olea europaea subsp. europaea TaxID=158383 RepID=A0A8S0QTG8_OLEEU|nr:glutathione S-transferase T1-like [Olea europaea subsp. europaea]
MVITEVNPMKEVPALVHGDFKLFESHAMLIYLASAFSGVADHWYPADLQKRAQIHSVLDWHHSNLRRGSATYIFNSLIALALGRPLNLEKAAEGEKILIASLAKIESFWLRDDGPFLLGNSQPSIADLSLACEVMQLELVETKDRDRILSHHNRILKWVEDTKSAAAPHFEELHSLMSPAKEKLLSLKSLATKEAESHGKLA